MNGEVRTISIARDFTRFPAGRFSSDGPYSGEEFRRRLLEPYLQTGDVFVVDFDGALGYGLFFLVEAFGGLVRSGNFGAAEVLRRVQLKSKDESLKREIRRYIERAASAK